MIVLPNLFESIEMVTGPKTSGTTFTGLS